MNGAIQVTAAILGVLLVAGCASILDPCSEVGCKDDCSGDTRLFEGVCHAGECRYRAEFCEHGCVNGSCSLQPPHLVIAEGSLEKGGFRLEIVKAEVDTGETDLYDLHFLVTNEGDEDGIFSMKSASIVAETGIMHDSVGFSWSDFIVRGEGRNIRLSIPDVPQSLREHNTTLVIRTNEGHFYFKARFEY